MFAKIGMRNKKSHNNGEILYIYISMMCTDKGIYLYFKIIKVSSGKIRNYN